MSSLKKGLAFLVVCVVIGVIVYFAMGAKKGDDEKDDPGDGGTVPSGQFVKIIQDVGGDATLPGNADDTNKIINLTELEVFDEKGVNIASKKPVTGSNEKSFKFANLVDGNMTNFAHTYGDASVVDFLQVDLGSVQKIKKIVITNRADCCKKRAIGIKAIIYGADGTTVIKQTPLIKTESPKYTITFPEAKWT